MESNEQEAHPTEKTMLMPIPRKSGDMSGRMVVWDLYSARNCRTVEVVIH